MSNYDDFLFKQSAGLSLVMKYHLIHTLFVKASGHL